MNRIEGSRKDASRFSDADILAVWQKGTVIPGMDPARFRKDRCGAIIEWNKYADKTHHGNGWEIDHINPVSNGGSDELWNLRPLQWQNNRAKGDNIDGGWSCAVSAR